MELGTFTPRPREEMVSGDKLQAQNAVDKPLIVFVREHKTGIKTKYNQDPQEKGYKPDGADGVIVDVADIKTNDVYIDVLWLNGAIVDNLAPYVGQAVPIKLAWTAAQGGGKPFIGVQPLDGPGMQQAQQWAAGNATRFDTERAQRQATANAWEAQQEQPAAALQTVPMGQPAPAPAPAVPAQAGPLNPNDPAVAALLAQLNAQTQMAAS